MFDSVQCARPHNSVAAIVWASIVITAIITYLMILLRFIARFVTVGIFWWDDWFHLLAGVFTIPLNVLAILSKSARRLLSQHHLTIWSQWLSMGWANIYTISILDMSHNCNIGVSLMVHFQDSF